jgi:hypothetical protein
MVPTMLLIGLLGMPIAISIWLTLKEDGPPGRIRWAVCLTTGSTALCALALLPFAGQATRCSVTWLPVAGTLHLSLGATSLYSLAATAFAAAVLFGLPGPSLRRGRVGGVVLLGLAAGSVAFLAGHFLLRYVALEVVGLCIAVAPLLVDAGRRQVKRAGWVYLLLRLGDAGMLVAVLLLEAGTGTLDVGPALADFAALSPDAQLWVIGGFYLAVAVKIGLWPFHTWLRPEGALSPRTHAWLYATLMPNLGLYLLYRVTPLLAEAPGVRPVVLGVGALSAVGVILALRYRRDPAQRAARFAALLGALVWCLAALTGAKFAWWGLLALSALRLPLYLRLTSGESARPALGWWSSSRLDRLAGWLYARVEAGGLGRLPARAYALLVRLASWIYTRVEKGAFEDALGTASRVTVAATENVYDVVERRGLEGSLRGVVGGVLAGSARLRRWHTGRLRISLGWLIVCLILALALAWVGV